MPMSEYQAMLRHMTPSVTASTTRWRLLMKTPPPPPPSPAPSIPPPFSQFQEVPGKSGALEGPEVLQVGYRCLQLGGPCTLGGRREGKRVRPEGVEVHWLGAQAPAASTGAGQGHRAAHGSRCVAPAEPAGRTVSEKCGSSLNPPKGGGGGIKPNW